MIYLLRLNKEEHVAVMNRVIAKDRVLYHIILLQHRIKMKIISTDYKKLSSKYLWY